MINLSILSSSTSKVCLDKRSKDKRETMKCVHSEIDVKESDIFTMWLFISFNRFKFPILFFVIVLKTRSNSAFEKE